ncbi:hypothetical protein [Bartonella sp. MR100HLJHH]
MANGVRQKRTIQPFKKIEDKKANCFKQNLIAIIASITRGISK